MSFYSATGELIPTEQPPVQKTVLKEVLEYKANGNLVRETDEKEVVTQATKLPSQPVFNSDNLGIKRRYIEEE